MRYKYDNIKNLTYIVKKIFIILFLKIYVIKYDN